jgi:hypothetical protein
MRKASRSQPVGCLSKSIRVIFGRPKWTLSLVIRVRRELSSAGNIGQALTQVADMMEADMVAVPEERERRNRHA